MSVYLDHNATTPLSPEVREAMRPFLEGEFGNASSVHVFGQRARAAVDRARRSVKRLAGGPGGDLVFTGSGTEAVFLAMVGAATALTARGRHMVVSAVEHSAALDAADHLAERGWEVSHVGPDSEGRISGDAVKAAVRDDTVLVSVMHANNETGVIQPVGDIADVCRDRGALYHVDAVQSAGKIAVDAEKWGGDFVSVAAHKLGGPQGVGALWKRPGAALFPVVPGTQERGLRGGTHNVAAIVGFGAAAELACTHLEGTASMLGALRNRLEQAMATRVPRARLTAARSERLCNTSHFTFDPEVGEDLVVALDMAGYAVSAGSACRSGSEEPSHVLLAMGIPPDRARTAVRVSVGRGNTEGDIDGFVDVLAELAGGPAPLRAGTGAGSGDAL